MFDSIYSYPQLVLNTLKMYNAKMQNTINSQNCVMMISLSYQDAPKTISKFANYNRRLMTMAQSARLRHLMNDTSGFIYHKKRDKTEQK